MKVQHTSKSKMTIPGVGETDEHGVIDVDDTVAGRPPAARVDELMTLILAEDDHFERLRLKDEFNGLDKGSGLLAQETWRPFGKAAKEAIKEDDK